jgi:UDP-3-O-[3-hydroxymyristoyl] glucosamine N-acyltransferase
MYRQRFFNKKYNSINLQKIIKLVGGKLTDDSKANLEILDVSTLEDAGENEISFLTKGSYLDKFKSSKAAAIFINEEYQEKLPESSVGIIHENPYFAYAKLAAILYEEKIEEFTSETLIHREAKIGANCKIALGTYIGKNVEIGENSIIGPNVSIMNNVIIGKNAKINANSSISFAVIGDNAYINSNVSIGQDGFGFIHDKGINHKIIQLGIVEIGNDFDIGANSCIDRGAINNTKIGNQVKIDNLVQIAHNVEIGDGTVIAGTAAVAGSTKIGKFCQIGGNTSVSGHLQVGNFVKIAGMSGVTKNLEDGAIVAGIPAVPIRDWHRAHKKITQLIKDKK